MIYSSNSAAVRHASSRLSAEALAQRLSLVARCPATAPRRSRGTSSTTTCCASAPPEGRAPLACAAVAGDDVDRSTSPDRTAAGLKKRVRRATAKWAKISVVTKATSTSLDKGALNVGNFLILLGFKWEVANGRFVKTNCHFLSYDEGMEVATVTANIYAFIDGSKRLVKSVKICGRIRGATGAEFQMTGLAKLLAAMGVAEGGPLELAGSYGEDGRTLSVELKRGEDEQAAEPAAEPMTVPEPAAPQPAALKQRRVRVKKVARPAAGMVQRKQQQRHKANKPSRSGDNYNISIGYVEVGINEQNNWW